MTSRLGTKQTHFRICRDFFLEKLLEKMTWDCKKQVVRVVQFFSYEKILISMPIFRIYKYLVRTNIYTCAHFYITYYFSLDIRVGAYFSIGSKNSYIRRRVYAFFHLYHWGNSIIERKHM